MPTSTRFLPLAAVCLALAAAAGACGGGDPTATSKAGPTATPAPTPGPVPTDRVDVRGFEFGPEAVTVPVGGSLTWTNLDGYAHSVVADDRSFRSAELGQGGSFSHTFAAEGTFTYFCGIHNYMTGSVLVR